MRIAVIGTGYVGLVTGACLAQTGHRVTCVDVDRAKISLLNDGKVPIYEPGLPEVIGESRRLETLGFSSDSRSVASTADVIFIAVGTPSKEVDGQADLTALDVAIGEIAPSLRSGCLVVIKSTVPIGTCDRIQEMIRHLRPKLTFDVASNPEFLRAGSAINDFRNPDRVVIGAESRRALSILSNLYRSLGVDHDRIVLTQRRSAELIKYAANGFLATKIAFINEIADLCESVDARVGDVALGIGLDFRIGRHFLNPGPGFGGSCFPKDARALAKTAEDNGTRMRILETVLASNAARRRSMIEKIVTAIGGDSRQKTIALLGLSFKAGTDDMRDSPAIDLAYGLVEGGACVRAYDPVAVDRARPLLPACVTYHPTLFEAARGADAAVIVTEWDEFRDMALPRLKRTMATPLLIDLRNILKAERAHRHGFTYYGIGNGSSGHLARAFQFTSRAWNRPRHTLAAHAAARDLIHDELTEKVAAAE